MPQVRGYWKGPPKQTSYEPLLRSARDHVRPVLPPVVAPADSIADGFGYPPRKRTRWRSVAVVPTPGETAQCVQEHGCGSLREAARERLHHNESRKGCSSQARWPSYDPKFLELARNRASSPLPGAHDTV